MQTPSQRTDSYILLKELSPFTVSQLESHEDTTHLGQSFRDAVATLEEKVEKVEEARRRVLEVEGGINWLEQDFYLALRKFHDLVIQEVGRDRRNPLYHKYFPGGLTEYNRKTLAGQVSQAREALAELDHETNPVLAGEGREIMSIVVTPLVEALDELAEKKAVHRRAENGERAAKENWRIEYKHLYYDLVKVFRNNPRMANAFFKKLYTPRKRRTSSEESTATEG